MRIRMLIAVALAFMSAAVLAAEPSRGAFDNLMTATDTSTARVSSYDHSGGNQDYRSIAPGQTLELANLDGAGIVRHLYFSILGGEHYLRDLVIRAYWDGAEVPCVEVPFGDFFGLGAERPRFFSSLMVTVNPGDLGAFGTFGFNSYFPMPYAKGARLTLTNEGTEPVGAVWYHVEYERMKKLPRDLDRFHGSWNRVNKTEAIGDHPNVTQHDGINKTGADNYVLLEAQGHGAVAGIFLNIDNTMGSWYGEGDDMIFIDGEHWPPSYHGTGTEEIFGGGACPTAEYAGPYTGFQLIHNLDYSGKVSMYRFYVNDPIRFQKSIRMTLEHGHANNIANDYSSTVFWYQDEPHSTFRPLPAAERRHPDYGTDPADVAYREMMALKLKVWPVWLQSVRNKSPLPEAMQRSMKSDLTQAYFRRDYAQLRKDTATLSRQLDEMLKATPKP
jgi:Protein of unknown function (DUF2961)